MLRSFHLNLKIKEQTIHTLPPKISEDTENVKAAKLLSTPFMGGPGLGTFVKTLGITAAE